MISTIWFGLRVTSLFLIDAARCIDTRKLSGLEFLEQGTDQTDFARSMGESESQTGSCGVPYKN
jgi:hypothetical protein